MNRHDYFLKGWTEGAAAGSLLIFCTSLVARALGLVPDPYTALGICGGALIPAVIFWLDTAIGRDYRRARYCSLCEMEHRRQQHEAVQ